MNLIDRTIEPDGAVLDEIQRAPDLASYIQPLVDENQREGQIIPTGGRQFEERGQERSHPCSVPDSVYKLRQKNHTAGLGKS
jgi:predicted AAA+ superfamily ATPase